MEKQQWITPVWCKSMCLFNDGKRKNMRCTYLDWGNAGPDVLLPTHHLKSLHLEGLCLEPSISSSPCFSTVKNIQKKFPLQCTFPNSYPTLHPQRLCSQNSFQYTLAGNCVDAVEIGGQTVVIHVQYANKNQVVVASKLVGGTYYQNDEIMERNTYFHLEGQNDVLLAQHVHQVVSKAVHNDVEILVRTPTTVQLFNLELAGSLKESLKIDSDSFTSNAALSSVVPGLWCLATTTGKVTLHDSNGRHPIWITHCRETKGSLNAPASIFKCDFGRHPVSLIVGNESSIYLYDTRVHPYSHRTLFDINKVLSDVSTYEQICSFMSSKEQPHLHIVTNESVYVIDDRHQKTPLMHWRHMMPERPTFSKLQKLKDTLEILILSNSQNKEVCVISSDWEFGRQQCYGVSVPYHFPTLHDTITFAHSRGFWFSSQMKERLQDSTLMGMTLVTHPLDNNSLLFLTMHSSGDIFMKTFQSSYAKPDLTVCSGNEQEITILLRKWETDVVDITTHSWSYHNPNYFDVTGFCNQILNRPSSKHIEEMLAGLPYVKLSNAVRQRMQITDSSENERGEQVLSKADNYTHKYSRNISNEKKNIHCDVMRSTNATSFVWNLKAQILNFKNNRTMKSTRGASWNKSLMETYIIDPILNHTVNLPLHFRDTSTKDSISKYLPESVLLELKIGKIKKCNDILSSKIMSLWHDRRNKKINCEEPSVNRYKGCSNRRLSSLLRDKDFLNKTHDFQYYTTPVCLGRLSAKHGAYQLTYNRTDRSPELDKFFEVYTFTPKTEPEINAKVAVKSKMATKKLKKTRRVDGF